MKNSRRSFLRASGVAIALPVLESSLRAATSLSEPPMRMVCIGNEFGMYPESFWPEETGLAFESTKLLKPLDEHRNQYTLFSGLDHDQKGGHFAVHTFLTGINAADAPGAEEGGISLDQRAAEHVGSATRFPSIGVGSDNGLHGGPMMSWTRTGTRVPPIPGPRELFNRLFVDEGAGARQANLERIALRRSILDSVLPDANRLKKQAYSAERHKLDEYFESVRSVEKSLELDTKWQKVPKPRVDYDRPENEGLVPDLPKIYDLLALALQTDSTRVATVEIGAGFAASDLGIKSGYHSLSHHGKEPAKIRQLVEIELYQTQQFARFLNRLSEMNDAAGRPLLDSTMVLFGSGMGNANSHTNKNLPIILAGGGIKHRGHVAASAKSGKVPLANLYVSMLQRFGVETDAFSRSTGTLELS